MRNRLFLLSRLVISVCLIAGCKPASEISDTATPDSAAITPYQTAAFTPTRAAVTTAPTSTPPPLPTPTPFMYTVAGGDTMIAIAVRFGVTLDELQAANPEVSPNFLTIGSQMVIPISFDDQENPGGQIAQLLTGDPECISERSGGVMCYWPVRNPLDQPVENISGMVRLYDSSGAEVASGEAVTLLNLLNPGEQIPLTIYFRPPVPEWRLAQAQLLTAVTVNLFDQRYLQGSVEDLHVEISEDGLVARMSGVVRLPADRSASYLWVLGVAYDTEGSVIGSRRWEAAAERLSGPVPFSFEVFSLGRAIENVEVFVEARGIQGTGATP